MAHEHLATSIVLRLMTSLYEHFSQVEQDKGKIIIAATAREQHEIGARMIADLLELDGWQVLYIGANTPDEDLNSLLVAEKPQILGLSVTMSYNLSHLVDMVQAIRSDARFAGLRILAGGNALQGLDKQRPPAWLKLLDAVPDSLEALFASVNRWQLS